MRSWLLAAIAVVAFGTPALAVDDPAVAEFRDYCLFTGADAVMLAERVQATGWRRVDTPQNTRFEAAQTWARGENDARETVMIGRLPNPLPDGTGARMVRCEVAVRGASTDSVIGQLNVLLGEEPAFHDRGPTWTLAFRNGGYTRLDRADEAATRAALAAHTVAMVHVTATGDQVVISMERPVGPAPSRAADIN
jgi:hypothetical protein